MDNNETFKELTDEEKKIIREKENNLRGSNRNFFKEGSLKINQQDVDIEDDITIATENNINANEVIILQPIDI